jgi:hypothetical protein
MESEPASNEIRKAEITVDRNDARAEHDSFDEYNVGIRDPLGELPPDFYEQVDEHVREVGDFQPLDDGETIRNFGYVRYDADTVHEITVWDGYKQ